MSGDVLPTSRIRSPVAVPDESRPPGDVDINIVAMPIEVAPVTEGKAEIDAGPVRDAETDADSRGIPVVGRVGRIPPWPVDIERVIVRHIDDIRIGRFNDDRFFFNDDLLFGTAGEGPLIASLGA